MRMSWLRPGRAAIAAALALALAAAMAAAPVTARASESSALVRWHVVQRGDTLAGLAARYGLSAASILAANGLADAGAAARALTVGQRVALPQAALPQAALPQAAGPSEASAPAADPLAGGVPAFQTRGKVIYVSLAKQRMWAYENGKLAFNVLVSTGIAERATKPGTYRVKTKLQEAWSRVWQLRMPYWMGIYDVGTVENGIHAMPFTRAGRSVRWRVGTPGSYGCVVLTAKDAAALYQWAPLGTLVIIRY
jgi:lipoprotein-anchoring transpeptidase ErfK/SrfK